MRAMDAQIGRWRETREGLEIVDEMGLVIVSAIHGDARPINLPLAVDLLHYLLETDDPAVQLWRQADFISKHIDKSPLAQARPLADGRDRQRLRVLEGS